MNDNFCPSHTVVELDTWERGPVFRHFIDDLRCVMSLTVDLEISRFLSGSRPVASASTRHDLGGVPGVNALRSSYGWDSQGRLVLWDRIEPYYAHFHPDRETFAKLVTPFSSDLETFHRRFLEDRTRYAALDHFDLTDVPPNTFDVSCLPWVRYRSFDMHIFDSGTYLAPVVTWGKYEREGARTVLPVSLNIHHAVADGFHLSRFFLELQDHGIRDQAIVNQGILRIHRETGLPMVCTNDAHYLRKEDAEAHDVLLCIQTGKTIDDENRMRYEPGTSTSAARRRWRPCSRATRARWRTRRRSPTCAIWTFPSASTTCRNSAAGGVRAASPI